MAPGCREAAVVRAWLQSGDKESRVEIFAAPSTSGVLAPHGTARNKSEGPWDRVRHGDARVVVKPLRLRALLAGTPLGRWAEHADLWKVLSGPDFPWQADLAARLAVGYKYGGHVAPFDFLKAPRRPASAGWPQDAYVYHNANAHGHANISAGTAWWEGGVGPFLLPAGHQLLSDWMVVVATSLERCADALRASSITEKVPCIISTPLFAGALEDANPVPSNAGAVFHSSGPRPSSSLVALDADAVWAYVLEPNTTSSIDAFVKTDAYAGAWLAQRFLGQTALSPGSALAAVFSAVIGGGAAAACMAAGAPWHTGCALYTRPSNPPAAPTMSSFGVLAVPVSYNVGDDIQGMASLRFLPFLGHFVDRDDWSTIKAAPGAGPAEEQPDKLEPGSIATIMNGWYRSISDSVPEETPLAPHFVALHLYKPFVQESRSSIEITRGLSQYQPIGVRDHFTSEVLQKLGVAAEFTGCVTTTLRNPWWAVPRSNKILLVPKHPQHFHDLLRLIPPQYVADAEFLYVDMDNAELKRPRRRFVHAWDTMQRYATAKLVVTTALHAALPSIAFDTPVLFLHDRVRYRYDGRFGGLADLFPTAVIYTNTTSTARVTDFDFDNPLPPSAYAESHARFTAMRDAMKERLFRACPTFAFNEEFLYAI